MAKKETNNEEAKVTEPTYSKSQVLASAKYSDKKDVINAVWTDDKEKTLETVDAMISEYLKGQVK